MMKIKQYVSIYDISSEPVVIFDKNIYQLNISAIINSPNVNKHKLHRLFHLLKFRTDTLYVKGLAALCGKLRISYGDSKCVYIINTLLSIAANNNLQLKESSVADIRNCGLKPFTDLYYMFDNTLFVNKVLASKFTVLGYTNSQLLELYNINNNLLSFLTSDLLNELPIMNNFTEIQYNKIKEYFV